jgi:hypothetical protein
VSDRDRRALARLETTDPADPSVLVRYLIERERSEPVSRDRGKVEVRVYVLPPRKRKPRAFALRPHPAIKGGRYVHGAPDEWWLDPIRRKTGQARFDWWNESIKLGSLEELTEALRRVRFVRWECVERGS